MINHTAITRSIFCDRQLYYCQLLNNLDRLQSKQLQSITIGIQSKPGEEHFWFKKDTGDLIFLYRCKLTRPNSEAQEILIWFAIVGDIRHIDVILTGRLGRLGSTPGLLVGMGFCIQRSHRFVCQFSIN